MAGRQSRGRRTKPGSPRVRDPATGAIPATDGFRATDAFPATDGFRATDGFPAESGIRAAAAGEPWFTTVPGTVDPAATSQPATSQPATRRDARRSPRADARRGLEPDYAESDDPDTASWSGPSADSAPWGSASASAARSASGSRADRKSRDRGSRADRAARADGADADPERDDPESVARLICLRLLTAAPRTQAELATAMRRRGVPADAADAVLARFAEVKLIDDATFARAWVESRHHGRGLAGRALRDELRRKGVGADDIASALAELDPDQELATARELVARRLPGTRGQPGPARTRRLVGLLARKGYPAGLAYRVVREALEQEPAGDEEAWHLDDVTEPDAEEGPEGFGGSGEF